MAEPWWKKFAGKVADRIQGLDNPGFGELRESPESGTTPVSRPKTPIGFAKKAVDLTREAEKRRRKAIPKAYRRDWMEE